MSGLCGGNSGSLLASFLATHQADGRWISLDSMGGLMGAVQQGSYEARPSPPAWMLKQIKLMPEWVATGAECSRFGAEI